MSMEQAHDLFDKTKAELDLAGCLAQELMNKQW